jgi:mannose-6-phosphate isomerase-like protein (cupin superfamily)
MEIGVNIIPLVYATTPQVARAFGKQFNDGTYMLLLRPNDSHGSLYHRSMFTVNRLEKFVAAVSLHFNHNNHEFFMVSGCPSGT